jgi:hypothetical protein
VLSGWECKASARIGENDANQRQRAVDVDIERAGIGNAMDDADLRGFTSRLLHR